jgi:hypothetical protein
MSSSATRRFKRKTKRDVAKGVVKSNENVRELNIPTEDDVKEYIETKLKQLKDDTNKS